MREARERIILLHMQEDINDAIQFVDGITYEAFKANTLIKKAVCMSLLNIGELVKELPENLKSQYPTVPWKSIVGLRNHTAHGYHSLDDLIVWQIVIDEITSLNDVVKSILNTI